MAGEKVTFNGSFPPIASAIKISGNGDGMRITIDVPESEMAKALMLMMYRQVPITVTVEPFTDCKTVENNDGVQKRSNRKSEWKAGKEPRSDSDT